MGVGFIVFVVCHHNVHNAKKASNPKSSFMSRGWLIGVIGLVIQRELKAADMLTLSHLLLTLKGASMSCYAVSVDSKPATLITFQ